MKKFGFSLTVAVLGVAVWAGCGSSSNDNKGKGSPTDLKVAAFHKGSFSLSCGRNNGNLDFQMHTPCEVGWQALWDASK